MDTSKRSEWVSPARARRIVALMLGVGMWGFLATAMAQGAIGSAKIAKAAQGTGISFQGELVDADSLATGNYDLRFRLFTALASGTLTGTPNTLTFTNEAVVGGLFNVTLDFGADAFVGDERFVEIAVRPGGSVAPFTVLAPRQKITAAPYALLALNAARVQPRRFYLTTNVVMGNAPTTACAAGYHMASLWELFSVGTLQYNTALGYTATDSGSGPPASIAGWIRTGVPSFTNTVPGNANCSAWTSSDPSHNGTRVNLQPQWANAAEFTSPWDSTIQACGSTSRVWCVED